MKFNRVINYQPGLLTIYWNLLARRSKPIGWHNNRPSPSADPRRAASSGDGPSSRYSPPRWGAAYGSARSIAPDPRPAANAGNDQRAGQNPEDRRPKRQPQPLSRAVNCAQQADTIRAGDECDSRGGLGVAHGRIIGMTRVRDEPVTNAPAAANRCGSICTGRQCHPGCGRRRDESVLWAG